MEKELDDLTQRLAKLATHYDVIGEWPEKSIRHLTAAGAWQWVIPPDYGGVGLAPALQLLAYEAIAAGCLCSLLILSQRDGACEFIAASDQEALKTELLPRLARHEIMASVGISQLGTSQNGGRPVLSAAPDGKDYRLTGFMPWVTAAPVCQYVVAGAVLPDRQEILLLLPMNTAGVVVDPPMNLAALQGSLTCEVHCRNALVPADYLLAGPSERVLIHRTPVKPLVVATAGIGLAGSMLRLVLTHAAKTTGPLNEMAEELAARYEAIRERLFRFADSLNETVVKVPAAEIRITVNDLLMRLAVAVMIYSKGAGFIRQRDAQRLAREALFFLIWSASETVRTQTLAGFLDRQPPEAKSLRLD